MKDELSLEMEYHSLVGEYVLHHSAPFTFLGVEGTFMKNYKRFIAYEMRSNVDLPTVDSFCKLNSTGFSGGFLRPSTKTTTSKAQPGWSLISFWVNFVRLVVNNREIRRAPVIQRILLVPRKNSWRSFFQTCERYTNSNHSSNKTKRKAFTTKSTTC